MIRYGLFCSFFITCFASGGGLYMICSSQASSSSQDIIRKAGRRCQDCVETLVDYVPACQQRHFALCLKGFSLQKQRYFTESNRLFARIYSEVEDVSFLLKEELLGGRILNAFFLKETGAMQEWITVLEKTFPTSVFLDIFKALWCYECREYEAALGYLKAWKDLLPGTRSLCLDESLSVLFAESFLERLEAYSLMHVGRFVESRILLNRLLSQFREHDGSDELYSHLTLMLCRSYLLELQSVKSPEAYTDYYEMLLFYQKKFEHSHEMLESYVPSCELIPILMEQIFRVSEQDVENIVRLIRHWEISYGRVEHSLVIHPLLQGMSSSYDRVEYICSLLKTMAVEGTRISFVEALEELLAEKMQQVRTDEAWQCITLLRQLAPERSLSRQIKISQPALRNIVLMDDETHTNLREYISLWEPALLDTQQLACQVVRSAAQLWKSACDDEKALSVLLVILELTHYTAESCNLVMAFVRQAYSQALEVHAIDRLLVLDAFLDQARLSRITLGEEDLANLLADAQYLYEQGEYDRSHLYSTWLMRAAPSSKSARLLLLNREKLFNSVE